MKDGRARTLAAGARALGQTLIKPRNIGQFTIGSGRFERVQGLDAVGRTFQVRRQCPLPFDAIRVGVVLGQTVAANAVTPLAVANVASVPSTTDGDLVAATSTPVSFAGNANPTFAPAAAFGRAKTHWSDWTRVASVERNDGGSGYLFVCRVYLYLASGTGNIIMMGDTAGSESFTNWANHPRRPFQTLSKGGGYAASNWSGMTAANSTAGASVPSVVFQVLYRGAVFNIGGFGDSITDGRGTYIGEGWGLPACIEASTPEALYEWTNHGWSGQAAAQILQNTIDRTTDGTRLDMAFVPGFFTNNVASSIPADTTTSLTTSSYRWMDTYRAMMEMTLDQSGIRTAAWTGLPADYSVRPWGSAGDARRISGNTRLNSMANTGRLVGDFAKICNGSVDANGQIVPGWLSDGTGWADPIHPNDNYNGLIAASAARLIKKATALTGGLLT